MWLTSHSNCPICRAPILGGIGIVENDHSHSQLGSLPVDHDSSSVLEIVIDSPGSQNISENERGNESSSISANNDNGGVTDSAASISETSSSLLGGSLKTMLSKVFPSSNATDLNQ